MSLDTVVEDIRTEARERAEEIRENAEREAEEIRENAEREAEEIRENAEREAERQVEQEREQALSSATLTAKQERLEARQDVLSEVREEVEAAVASIEGDRRERLTRALLDAAADEFGDGDLEVYSAPDDADLVSSICDEDGYERFERAGDVDALGGVVVESASSRVRVDNTFDAVLDEVWEENLKTTSDHLFE